ncbi:aminodeoxychorismate lyase [Gordonia sp. NPDC062954]|uniref:Aminodeoxychorismate lyase n=1 Tax=Gordonia aquimaris TaxID=2984863 RepID=A0A9X3I4H3_9ACTN|nr:MULTISPECIES: aminodeoxychorismate lyase [Gordonia]MAU82679.1 4-amino-4-deoxychorismate lyase [Gordonia sp. (in: high G+C Gram-positive bacteria)]MCX2963464.1 aminodeoxychorismate lyase [Gordonia aquimaris]
MAVAQILVTLDGTVHDPDVPFLHADDLAALRGDGVFETLLIRSGRTRKVGAHLDRLERSAAMMELPAPDRAQWRGAIEVVEKQWSRANPDAEAWLRLVYSRGRESVPDAGPTAYLMAGPVADRVAAARSEGVSVVTLDRGFSTDLADRAPWQLLGAKTLSYATNMAALRYAAANGFDDVIYLSSEGSVLEGPRSTVVTVTGTTLTTPPSEAGILPGTTQRAVFETAASEGWTTRTDALGRADLIAADSVWLISSVALAARVTSLNRYIMPVSPNHHDFVDLVDRAICVDRE